MSGKVFSEQNISGDAMFDSGELVFDQLLHWTAADYPQLPEMNQEDVIPQQQEDTMDANTKFSLVLNEYAPISPIGPPERENFTGDLKFEVEICGADTNRSKYMYSHRLNRIYVDMGYNFSVQLKWDSAAQIYPTMFVRATPVFSDEAQAEKRVTRCIQHYHEKSRNDVEMSEAMRGCVLHSTRDAGTQDVFYCGGQPDVWYSVVVRFAAPSTHAYQFTCKNSCSSGINRRTIAIIFTLEDYTGTVWGRQSVGARVCSCPKRDMKREEEEETPRGKRPMTAVKRTAPTAPTTPRSKKILLKVRQENVGSEDIVHLPPIPIGDRCVMDIGLRVILVLLEQKRAIAFSAQQPTEQLDSSIAQLKQHLGSSNEET